MKAVKYLFYLVPVLFVLFVLPACHQRAGIVPIDRRQIAVLMDRVADRQIADFRYSGEGSPGRLHDHGIDAWTNATFYLGLLEWALTAPDAGAYPDWLEAIGEKTSWTMPANFVNYSYGLHHADELCIGRFYLGMWEQYRRPEMLSGVKGRIDAIMADPPSADMTASVKQSWTWCDALFMAPPVYASLAAIEGDEKYLVFMDTLFKRTYRHLYDADDGLFFRDDSYFDQREANGEKVYWGRGNGWVAAGLAGLLEAIPDGSPYRPFYEDLFRRHVARLASLQDDEGFWHASLLDPGAYPAPETSATALIVYAVAWGINNGVLDGELFGPVVTKGWQALETTVDDSGQVGWVQPIGASPASVTAQSTAVYGVGALLLAGAEVYELTKKRM